MPFEGGHILMVDCRDVCTLMIYVACFRSGPLRGAELFCQLQVMLEYRPSARRERAQHDFISATTRRPPLLGLAGVTILRARFGTCRGLTCRSCLSLC